mgnify:CR=1 FL=1
MHTCGYGTKSAIYGSISSAFPLTMVPGAIVTLTHFDIWNDYEICEVSEKDFQNRHYV